MDDIPTAREISDSALEAMVRVAVPTWELREAVSIDRGFCSVYRLEVSHRGTIRELYLKASPDGRDWGIPTEARLEAVLGEHTSIPVPEVLGVTDDHETLPTPYYLMSGLPGQAVAYEQICRLEDDVLRRIARETGRYMAELHSIPAIDAFGHVRHGSPPLYGGRPDGDVENLTTGDPHEDWPTFLQVHVDEELDRLAESRFADLTPRLRRWFEAGIEGLDGPYDPVLGRNDHGLHNLLIDPGTGEIIGMLDWAYTLAVPAAFDFEFAAYLYGGAFLAGLADASDRRPLVRQAMLSGYRAADSEPAGGEPTHVPLYEGLAMVRIMNDVNQLDLPDGAETDVCDGIRSDVRALVQR